MISTLGAFLNEKLPRNAVDANRTQTGAGKPSKDIKILNDAPHKQWGTLEVQLSGSPLVLRITDSALGAWCKRTGRPKANLQAAMKKTLGAKMLNVVIGAGSHLAGAKENTWVIDATGTVLEASLEYTIAHGKFEPPIPSLTLGEKPVNDINFDNIASNSEVNSLHVKMIRNQRGWRRAMAVNAVQHNPLPCR